MKHVLAALVVAAIAASTAHAAPDVPQPFCVCVTTADAAGVARVDSCVSDQEDARDRRAAILSSGWVTSIPLPSEVAEGDREYAYAPHAIVKAFVDPTLVNGSACAPVAPVSPSVESDAPARR